MFSVAQEVIVQVARFLFRARIEESLVDKSQHIVWQQSGRGAGWMLTTGRRHDYEGWSGDLGCGVVVWCWSVVGEEANRAILVSFVSTRHVI